MPNTNGTYSQGNMDLQPNPSNRLGLKFGFTKNILSLLLIGFPIKIIGIFYEIDGKTVSMPTNFNGSVKKYNINFNTNQTFFKK
jgi:hypothetical protein